MSSCLKIGEYSAMENLGYGLIIMELENVSVRNKIILMLKNSTVFVKMNKIYNERITIRNNKNTHSQEIKHLN